MKRTVSALLLVVLLAGSAFGLSDKDYKRMKSESKIFREADKKLGVVWHRIEGQVTKAAQSVFEMLREDQREWIRTGRDKAARRQKNEGFDDEDAYTIATYERIGYLEGWEAVFFGDRD